MLAYVSKSNIYNYNVARDKIELDIPSLEISEIGNYYATQYQKF